MHWPYHYRYYYLIGVQDERRGARVGSVWIVISVGMASLAGLGAIHVIGAPRECVDQDVAGAGKAVAAGTARRRAAVLPPIPRVSTATTDRFA